MTVAVLTLLVALLYWFFVMPQYRALRQVLATRSGIEQQLNNVNKELEEIDNMAVKLQDISENEILKINKAMPYGESLEEFLANTDKLAQQSGMLITNMDVRPLLASEQIDIYTDSTDPEASTQVSADVQTSQLNMALRGRYADFLDFINSLEQSARLVDVQDIAIRNTSASSEDLSLTNEILQISIAGYIYHLSPPSAEGSGLFPYGANLDTSLLESPQYKSLQIIASPIPTGFDIQLNPFAPAN